MRSPSPIRPPRGWRGPGGGNIRPLAPGASAVGTTATIRTVLARPLGRRHRHDHDRRWVRRHVPDHGGAHAPYVPVRTARGTDDEPDGRRCGDVLLAVPHAVRRERLGPGRRLGAGLHGHQPGKRAQRDSRLPRRDRAGGGKHGLHDRIQPAGSRRPARPSERRARRPQLRRLLRLRQRRPTTAVPSTRSS